MRKQLVFTRHAVTKIDERDISTSWVEAVVRNPLWIEPEPRDLTAERRFGRIDEFGGRCLRVVGVETQTTIRV